MDLRLKALSQVLSRVLVVLTRALKILNRCLKTLALVLKVLNRFLKILKVLSPALRVLKTLKTLARFPSSAGKSLSNVAGSRWVLAAGELCSGARLDRRL